MVVNQRIEFYPVNIVLDEDIIEELKKSGKDDRGYSFVDVDDEGVLSNPNIIAKEFINRILICENEQGFIDALRDIFNAQKVAKIIQSLYSQSLSMKGD